VSTDRDRSYCRPTYSSQAKEKSGSPASSPKPQKGIVGNARKNDPPIIKALDSALRKYDKLFNSESQRKSPNATFTSSANKQKNSSKVVARVEIPPDMPLKSATVILSPKNHFSAQKAASNAKKLNISVVSSDKKERNAATNQRGSAKGTPELYRPLQKYTYHLQNRTAAGDKSKREDGCPGRSVSPSLVPTPNPSLTKTLQEHLSTMDKLPSQHISRESSNTQSDSIPRPLSPKPIDRGFHPFLPSTKPQEIQFKTSQIYNGEFSRNKNNQNEPRSHFSTQLLKKEEIDSSLPKVLKEKVVTLPPQPQLVERQNSKADSTSTPSAEGDFIRLDDHSQKGLFSGKGSTHALNASELNDRISFLMKRKHSLLQNSSLYK